VERPGEFGTLYGRTPGGDWLPEEGRYAGRWEGTQFVLIDVDAGRPTTTTTPALPPANDSPPPLPAWGDTPEPLPGYQAAPPAGPTGTELPWQPQSPADSIITRDANAENNGTLVASPGLSPEAAANPGLPLLNDDGSLRPGVLDPNAHPLQQAHALAQQLQALGLDAEQASQIALEQVGNSLPPRAAPQPDPEAALHDPDGSLRLQTVFVTGRALPRDALGNAYDTDAQGRQIVLLAGGGIVALSPTDAIRIPGGLATPSAQQLGLLARAVGVAGLLLTPGNAGQNGTDVLLHDNLRYVERPGEFGQLVSRTPGGSWLAEEGRYAGRWEGTQFVLIDVDAGRPTTTTTPALPPSNDSPPPLPAWAATPEPLPGYQAAPPVGPSVETFPAEQMRLDDLIIESRGLAPGSAEHKAAAWDAYSQRQNDGWDYERWSKTYEQNQVRAAHAREAEIAYQREIGWGTVQGAQQSMIIDGLPTSRRLDIVDENTRRGVEVKTGYQSATADNVWELRRDAELVSKGWEIEWVFTDTRPSQPLLDRLAEAGIKVTIRPGS
jgi:hypothetical protein